MHFEKKPSKVKRGKDIKKKEKKKQKLGKENIKKKK